MIYRNEEDGSVEKAIKDNIELPFREKVESIDYEYYWSKAD